MHQLTCSIVLYNNEVALVQKAIDSVLQTRLPLKLYLIDNSQTDNLKTLASHPSVSYIFNNKNLGFGKAHNIAIKKSIDESPYHLVLNPDIEFKPGVLESIYQFMEEHHDVGQLLPKVFYNNGNLQKLCHLLPAPVNLVGRRFFENMNWSKRINDEYELNGFAYNRCLNIPNLSGCFMFLRCNVLKQVGLFDERYFMYMEDIDLCRRIHAVAETIFFPEVSIIHGFEKESYSNRVVLKHHIQSAIKYFNKWGWFIDKERKRFNDRILQQVNENIFNKQVAHKPRLLILTNRLIVGGISNDIIPLAYYLQSDFDILILYGEKEKDEIEAAFLLENYPGLKLKKVTSLQKSFNPLNDIISYKKIKKEIKDFNADIVHTHGAKSGFIGRIAARKNKVAAIVHTFHGHHFHSYYNKNISSLILYFERRLAHITTLVIAISKWQKKELAEIYKMIPAKKIATIPLGIETTQNLVEAANQRDTFRKKYCVDDDTIAIGIVGRIVPVKNLKLFVQVADRLLKSTSKKICFFIVGDGALKKQIQAYCRSLNINYTENAGEPGDIIFTSWIENIMPAMHAMDIVTLTSVNEGTPLSLIEAQYCRKPVIATNVGGVRDILIDGETGFLVESNDCDAMTEKLKLLIENNELRISMGRKAVAFATENFSKQKEVENYNRLYKQLLQPKTVDQPTGEKIFIE
jgi:glycosyltransferase involved in cell wall biosynthesis/GT2 family glycosyltransferase